MNSQTLSQAATPFSEAITDIIGALRQFPSCLYLAVISVKLRYKRSILGPLWITITTAIFIFFISYLYTGFIRADFRHYLLNLALGWIIWQFIADSVLQGAQTFKSGARIIQGSSMEKFFLVLQTVLTNLIIFAHNLLIAAIVLIIAGPPISATTFLVIPGLALIGLSALWSATLFGLLCARYRDLFPILQAIMRVLFFVTPIIWSPTLLAPDNPRLLFVSLNPLAHYVEVWRGPLMGGAPDALTWLVAGGCTLLGLAVAFIAFARYRRWVVFWV
jgi:ABC-type polysaccharide/polyol phosphate export permease